MTKKMTLYELILLVDAPIAPIKMEGMAIMRQPKAAKKDRTCAYVAEEADNTL